MSDDCSKGHLLVRGLLASILPLHQIYEEYNYGDLLRAYYKKNKVSELNQNQGLIKTADRYHADFYDKTGGFIIEYQGEMHTELVSFGKKDTEEDMIKRLENQKYIDGKKRLISRECEIKIIEIFHYEEVNEDFLWKKILT